MLIIRGVTVHSSSVEAVLREIPGVEQHQIVIERKHALDEATVLIAMSETLFFDEMKRQSEFRDKVRRRLASELGVSFEVKLVDRKTSESLAGKGKVLDLRKRQEGGEPG
jgi:phenylacetate-CoA ligase